MAGYTAVPVVLVAAALCLVSYLALPVGTQQDRHFFVANEEHGQVEHVSDVEISAITGRTVHSTQEANNKEYQAGLNESVKEGSKDLLLGFLRSAEVLNLMRCDIQLSSTHTELFIEQSKTDIYRDGSWVLIARTDNKLCPVRNLKIYLQLAEISDSSSEYIFRNVTKCKDRYTLRKCNKPMIYSRLRESFLHHFSSVVPDISKYGLHSFRAGGATAAANGGVVDRLFKRHGRWRSETAKDGYVKDSVVERLSVSQNLGL
ncbi:uncharacterized protein LOC117315697 [Pecten maximus]|uniref:uncharacterized protein LOC117315697 n=1 Tax=Pecten maximus TaxID=6579 RepID=UPI00145864ED|nr:uncharacterized protein LOC117315697 [Pecten maximus]